MINKMRILIYKTHLVTMKIHIENTLKYWNGTCLKTGESAIENKYLIQLKEACEECERQIMELAEFEVNATAQGKAHNEFGHLILKDTQNIRRLEKDKFPIGFVIGSFSIPYIIDSMKKFNPEVRKLKKNNLETTEIEKHLADYMEMVRNIII